MKTQRMVVLQTLVLLVALVHAQEPVIPDRVRAAADSITAEQLKRDLDFLASDALLGRNTPSPGFDTAANYIAKRLEKAGVKPLGDKGTYFQHYEMRESRVDTGTAYIEIGGRRFLFGSDFGLRSFAVPLSGSLRGVYVGHGWTIPGRGIDPFANLDVRGKLVIVHGPRAMPKGIEVRQIGRISIDAISPQDEAARRGAAAVLFIPTTVSLKTWEQTRGNAVFRREMEPSVQSAYSGARVTSLMLSAAATEALMTDEKVAGPELITLGDSSDYPPAFELKKSITANIPLSSNVVHRPFNVVGMVEGSDPVLKNEYVTIESHLDGAVGNRTIEGDAIYNSADDNASGSAGNLAIAERIVAVRPKRSIVFIWDSGEEQGLWGTRYFVGHPPVPLKNVVAHFNVDMIGANRAPGSADENSQRVSATNEVYVSGPGALSSAADALLQKVNAAYLNMKFLRDYDTPESEFFYPRTDAGPFLERGVLTINFFTGIHPRYHQPADEARHLDPRKMEAITRTIFASAWAIADSGERIGIDKEIPATVPRYK